MVRFETTQRVQVSVVVNEMGEEKRTVSKGQLLISGLDS